MQTPGTGKKIVISDVEDTDDTSNPGDILGKFIMYVAGDVGDYSSSLPIDLGSTIFGDVVILLEDDNAARYAAAT